MNVGKNRPVALITGASGGIGKALAHEIAADGYDLVLVSRDQNQLNKVGAELGDKFGLEWQAIGLDLSAPDQVATLVEKLQSLSIEPELIVNNAGYGLAGPAATGDVEQLLGSIKLNVSVLTELTLVYLPGLVAKNHGGIINVGSVAGFFPGPDFSVYYATKAYVHSFTYAVAHEVRKSNVKICTICPGRTATGFHKRAGIKISNFTQSSGTMTAGEVAKLGYAGYKKGHRMVVTGKLNRFLVLMSYLIPTSWFVSVVSRFNKT